MNRPVPCAEEFPIFFLGDHVFWYDEAIHDRMVSSTSTKWVEWVSFLVIDLLSLVWMMKVWMPLFRSAIHSDRHEEEEARRDDWMPHRPDSQDRIP